MVASKKWSEMWRTKHTNSFYTLHLFLDRVGYDKNMIILWSFKSRSSSNLSIFILIWNHSRSPTWSKSSPPDVNQLLMRRRPILSNFTTGKERALLRFCCLMWRRRRNRNRTDQQTGMCSPLMRFDLKGKKERALLKCLIALLWIGNIFYKERSSDLCRLGCPTIPIFLNWATLS